MNEKKKGKHCPICADKFGWPEFSSYLANFKSTKVFCLSCQKESLFQIDWDVKKVLLAAYAMGVGLIIFMIVYAIFNITPVDSMRSSRRADNIVFAVCAGLAYFTYLFFWKIFIWLFLPFENQETE